MMMLILLLCGMQANAQKLFDLGVKAGISRDNMQLDNVADYRAVMGWHAGIFARLKPPLMPGGQMELLFNTMGTDLRIADTIAGDARIRLNYLQMPLFLVFSLGPAELHLGGYASYLMNASITKPASVVGEVQQLRENQYQDMDYGLLGGAGLRLGSFYAGARYTFGLGAVGVSGNSILSNARNMQAQFYIGFGFNR
jgi:hypothetical protein